VSNKIENRDSMLVFHFPHYQIERARSRCRLFVTAMLKLVHFYETGQSLLFELTSDIAKKSDLSAAQPERLSTLRRALRDYLKKVEAPMPRLNQAWVRCFPDVDQDGLNDDWEFRELLTTAYTAADDPDRDGKVNAVEFKEMADPLP
jgi:hypothetical protein